MYKTISEYKFCPECGGVLSGRSLEYFKTKAKECYHNG